MTIHEIHAALETLKDYVNADGKSRLTALQAAVAVLEEPQRPLPADVARPLADETGVKLEDEQLEPADTDRRAEPRDPGEGDQHRAEDLKLAPVVKPK